MHSRRFDTPLSPFSPDALQSELAVALTPEARTWLQVARDKILGTKSVEDAVSALLLTSAMARRKLGEQALPYQPEGTDWQVDQAGRLLLLLTLRTIVPATNWSDVLFSAYRQFDENEKIVVVRALDWLSSHHELNRIAHETARTNDVNLFAALALNNAYPVKYFNERAFHQLVLKALFLDLNIESVRGLPLRQSAELTQLCADLVQERLLAERAVPESVWLGMRFRYLSDSSKDTYLGYVFSESDAHQYYTLLALANNGAQDCPDSFWQRLSARHSPSLTSEVQQLIDHLLTASRFGHSQSLSSLTGYFNHDIF
ncbi:EboA domain-containing protein [Photobacterium sp. SP02]|uniref:EboA domain-containing protein n=1 Tax=Photobacterium sp. SP02 TaxID=3032280 RepID=UPI0031450220